MASRRWCRRTRPRTRRYPPSGTGLPRTRRFASASGALGQKVVSRVAGRLRGRTLREQFAFYAQQHGRGAKDTSRFNKTKRIRDNAVHGDEVDVTVEVAHEAEQLLRAMLKSEFAIAEELPWEKQPRIQGMRLVFKLVPATETPDSGAATPAVPDGSRDPSGAMERVE